MRCPRFVTTLHRRNLLSTDDWRTFSEVFPLFDPVFVFCTCPVGGKRGGSGGPGFADIAGVLCSRPCKMWATDDKPFEEYEDLAALSTRILDRDM